MEKLIIGAYVTSVAGKRPRKNPECPGGRKQATRKNPHVMYVGLEVCSLAK